MVTENDTKTGSNGREGDTEMGSTCNGRESDTEMGSDERENDT